MFWASDRAAPPHGRVGWDTSGFWSPPGVVARGGCRQGWLLGCARVRRRARVCVCVSVFVSVAVSVSVSVSVSVPVPVPVSVCVHACVRACVCACVWLCVVVCDCVCVCLCARACDQIWAAVKVLYPLGICLSQKEYWAHTQISQTLDLRVCVWPSLAAIQFAILVGNELCFSTGQRHARGRPTGIGSFSGPRAYSRPGHMQDIGAALLRHKGGAAFRYTPVAI